MSDFVTRPKTPSSATTSQPTSDQASSSSAFSRIGWKTPLKIVFAIALLTWMIRTGALNLSTFVQLASPGLIAVLILTAFMQLFVNNYRWLCLLRGQGFDSSMRATLPLSFIGGFFNFAMPGGVGGDVIKGYYLLQEHPEKKLAAAVSIFMDRMVGFFIMVATAFIAFILSDSALTASNELKSVAFGVSLLFVAFIVFFAVCFSPFVHTDFARHGLFGKIPGGEALRGIIEKVHMYRHSPRALVVGVAMSFLNQFFMIVFSVLVARAMGVNEIPIAAYFFLVPVGVVVQALPISPAGIGVGQAAFYFLFNNYLGHKSDIGPTIMTSMQLVNLFLGLFGAYFYLTRKKPTALAQPAS